MLYTIAVILLILWLLGFVSGYTIGAFIHVLLVIALVLLLVQFDERPACGVTLWAGKRRRVVPRPRTRGGC